MNVPYLLLYPQNVLYMSYQTLVYGVHVDDYEL